MVQRLPRLKPDQRLHDVSFFVAVPAYGEHSVMPIIDDAVTSESRLNEMLVVDFLTALIMSSS